MKYKEYIAKVEYDDEADIFHGDVINIRDVITFQGKSVEELKEAFIDSVEDYIEFCSERGEEPDKPFSGSFTINLPPDLHKKIVLAIEKSDKNLDNWVKDVFENAVSSH
ncbi:type II toxin-antitoxin system HicB family antitoxin [Desulfonema magnum]|uniref:Toxin-antitoxin system, antitoxin component, HigB domain-containing protein n=1 Tax=Desulfonema magnum TaxID=45655 RepID=A0A975GM95_9BACT|nr:type II toxin-antitoxin system HicB family antitoxin [Desulfonema magnum]QTA86415.1 Toxin-antitoxin system, antitoxin component, HigB domain-containing protein [Desulfonema magnum]